MSVEIVVMLMFFGLITISMSFMMTRKSQLEELRNRLLGRTSDRRKEKVKGKKARNLEEELDKILGKAAEKVDKSRRLEEGTGVPMGIGMRLQDNIINTLNNPYNQTSAVKMVGFIAFIGALGLLSGALLTNAAIAISGLALGVVTPFSLINLRGLKKQMGMMKGNLLILMNHYPNYLDSSTFEESLVRTIANVEQNTPQCKAFRVCLNNMQENNMPLSNAINILRKQLIADKYVNYYLDGIIKSETDDKEYKNVLGSILTQFDYLVRQNSILSSFALVTYIIYVGGLVGIIMAIAALRVSDPEVYKLLAFTLAGQATIVAIFALAGFLGFLIAHSAKLIHLDVDGERGGDA